MTKSNAIKVNALFDQRETFHLIEYIMDYYDIPKGYNRVEAQNNIVDHFRKELAKFAVPNPMQLDLETCIANIKNNK